jgi:hypothetical protein
VANRYDVFRNVDWLKKHAKAERAKHKDAITTVDCCINKTWQEGRRNAKMHDIFIDNLLPCVIKKLVFDCQVSVAADDRTLCTVSDEAFALLLLENSFDRWQDIYQLRKGEVAPKRGQKRREFESDVPTRYAKGGIVYDKTVKKNDPQGWSAEGIKRYNELYAMVKKDRKTNKTFTINWLAKRKANLFNAVQTRKRKRPQQQARIELLDSEDDDSGNETASADKNGAKGTDNELRENESD